MPCGPWQEQVTPLGPAVSIAASGQSCQSRTSGSASPVFLCGLCTSSLDMANLFLERDMLPEWGSVLVSSQTAGRGQLGRSWHSAAGNLFAAVRLPMAAPFDGMAAAPALGAYLVTVLRHLGYKVWFKWPNDVVGREDGQPRKLCGILLEERHGALVAGIGVNAVTPPPGDALREGHALDGGCLPALGNGPRPGLLPLWLQLVDGIKFCYEQIPPVSGRDFSGEPRTSGDNWRQLAEPWLLYKDCPVALVDGAHDAVRLRGRVAGLAPDGGLRLLNAGGMHTVHSGSLIPE